ncbi:XkdX family protein [Intestinimonas butyriciproducens]|nr:XkdX family protein [Intestinimonas butyriciproducens]
MSARAKALANLYRRGKVTEDGLKQAAADGVITAGEYRDITGEEYA